MNRFTEILVATVFAVAGTMTGGWIVAITIPQLGIFQAATYVGIVTILTNLVTTDAE